MKNAKQHERWLARPRLHQTSIAAAPFGDEEAVGTSALRTMVSTHPVAADGEEAFKIAEGTHWLAYAAAAYMTTPAKVISRLKELGVPYASEDDIIYAQLEAKPLLQPHYMIRDPVRKAIVISIRGTATLRDLIADMAARPIPFAGGAAHTGTRESTTAFWPIASRGVP